MALAIPSLFVAALACASVAYAQNLLTAEGTEFVLKLSDGRVMRSADLVGAEIWHSDTHSSVRVRIEAVETGTGSDGRPLFLHSFSIAGEDGRRKPLCSADPSGDRRGFPIPDGEGGYALRCVSGAPGKCVFWGYRPWEEVPRGPPMRALHAACTRMVRADYGGDGMSATLAGTQIGFCDRHHVRPCGDQRYSFEAAWGADGAVCVARPRLRELTTLADLSRRYPHLRGRLGASKCGPATAFEHEDSLILSYSL